ncbi:MAG: substrate-binding domain-containing protein, partial [Pseudobutyrivibrio sp.]|nr:substrate-binding domain-containing protein [Pseudobutyrivibrio sp.]
MFKILSRKFTSAILIAALSLLSLVACGSSTDTATEAADEPSVQQSIAAQDEVTYSGPDVTTIGISMPAVQLERWLTDGALLKQMFEDAGYNVLITYGDNLIDTQINEINQMIDEGAQLLIICPVDSDSLSPCIEKAHEKNIPIVAYDRLIYHDPNLLAFVSYDNYMVGALQADYIVDSLDLDNPDNKETYNLEIFSG